MENQKREILLQTLERLKKLEEILQQIQLNLRQIESKETTPKIESNRLDSNAILEINLMNLPDSLRKTMIAIAKLKEATPEQVAEETNRTRGLENVYLNQLEMLGHIEKVRRGRRVFYRVLRVV